MRAGCDRAPAPAPQAYIAVIGAGDATPAQEAFAEACGQELARRGAVVVCGGLGGVMAAASRGAHEAGGVVVGHDTWAIDGVAAVDDPVAAVDLALALADERRA